MSPTLTSILRIRERLIVLFRNHESIALFILKLLAGFVLFGKINSVGHYREELGGFITFAGGVPYTFGLSVIFAAAPPVAALLVVLLSIILQISLSLELALMVFLIGVCIIVFYCRLEPQKSYIIIAMILGFYFKVPYVVVLLSGLYIGFSAIIPVTIGTAIWSFLPLFAGLAGSSEHEAAIDVTKITNNISDIYISIQAQATGDLSWIFSAFIFAMVIILVYAISRLTINYAKELSLLLGGFLCIFGGFMAASVSGDSIAGVIGFTLLSVVMALVARFFDIVLDYKRAEYVEFEDEDNYYYVKIVNKLNVSADIGRQDTRGGVGRRTSSKRSAPKPRSRPKPTSRDYNEYNDDNNNDYNYNDYSEYDEYDDEY